MAKKDKISNSCSMEAVVNVDSRGQIVLPKDLRDRAGIETGDKLLVVSCEEDEKICCITLIKADESNDLVKEMIGPMLKGIIGSD